LVNLTPANAHELSGARFKVSSYLNLIALTTISFSRQFIFPQLMKFSALEISSAEFMPEL
jgi:hypothetical protein